VKRITTLFLLVAMLGLPASAARVRVHRGPAGRVHVTVRPGFPIHRTLPAVVVRGPVVRVAPRAYLAPVTFGAVVVASLPPAERQVWRGGSGLQSDEGWTEFNVNVDQRGDRLLMQIVGAAQISFAEVVFENGDAQVVDFNDRVHQSGLFQLLDFKDGRKIDHIRVVAKSDTPISEITMYLTT
jgi:hypothetical protein